MDELIETGDGNEDGVVEESGNIVLFDDTAAITELDADSATTEPVGDSVAITATETTIAENAAVTQIAANGEAEPTERIMIAGIPVDAKSALDPERVEKVTSGRRKIPLSMMFRPGGTDMAQSAGLDIYLAVVCVDTIHIQGEPAARVSNLIFSGSSEATVTFADSSQLPNGVSVQSLKNTVLLILNPSVTGNGVLRVPSLRACLKLGSLSGLSRCVHEGCSKPVLNDRDGPLCYMHAASNGVRVLLAGTMIDLKDDQATIKARNTERKSLTADAQKAKDLEDRRLALMAKKKTALLLLNRNSGAHAQARLSAPVEEDILDIGESLVSKNDEEKIRLARFEVLKRKRETIEKSDAIKQRQKENKERAANVALALPPVVKPVVGPRKSMTKQLADQIKAERGY